MHDFCKNSVKTSFYQTTYSVKMNFIFNLVLKQMKRFQ